jgi:hypothetical protein
MPAEGNGVRKGAFKLFKKIAHSSFWRFLVDNTDGSSQKRADNR